MTHLYSMPKRRRLLSARQSRLGASLATAMILVLITSCEYNPADTTSLDQARAAAASLHPDEYRAAVLGSKNRADLFLSLYRDPASRADTIAFFAAIIHSDSLARIILEQAETHDLSPALMTAVAWEESRFNPQALNRNSGSVDRGLFQLNSKSFPNLTEKDFFDPETNTRFAAAHLRWCLDYAQSEVAALAMYNAGTSRVQSGATPKKTLDYVSRILDFTAGIEALVASQLLPRWEVSYEGLVQTSSTNRSSYIAALKLPGLKAAR